MKSQKLSLTVFACLMIFATMIASVHAFASPPAVDLGTADDFVVLAKTGISTTGVTSITGDIGVSPIDSTAITGFGLIMDVTNEFSTSSLITGNVYASDYTAPTPVKMTTAISDMETAYTDAAGRTLPDATELGAGDISGMTLAPGLYKWSTGVHIDLNGVTLSGNANDVWIFQIAQDLTVDSAAIVHLIGGAQAKNIFWQVGGGTGVSLGTTSEVAGNILATKAIIFNTGATLTGRALAQTAVTFDANTVSVPVVSAVPVLTAINVTPAAANVSIGSTLQLTAASFDQFGAPIAATIVFNSNNTSIATVNSVSGLVTAVAAGNTTITASSGNVTGTSIISVPRPLPVLNAIGPKSVVQGTSLNFTVSATSPSGLPLTMILSGKPSAATFTDNGDGTASFSWTPTALDVGSFNLNFSVTDGFNTVSEMVVITVNLFSPPTTIVTNPGAVGSNVDFNVTLNATGFNGSTVAYINYTLNGIAGQIIGNVGDVFVNTTGSNVIVFYAVDTAGNVESPTTIQSLLDKAAPSITSFTLSATDVFRGDSLSGVCTATDVLDANPVTSISGVDTSSTGTFTATCTATDASGNTVQTTLGYNVDVRSGGGGGGGSGGGGSSGNSNSNTGTTSVDAVTPVKETVAPQPKPDANTAGDQNTETVSQNDNAVVPAEGSLATGQAIGPLGQKSSWLIGAAVIFITLGVLAGGYYFLKAPVKPAMKP